MAKAHRAIALARKKAYYNAQPARTLANKKARLAKQVRHFPEDTMAVTLYTERYGEASAKSMLDRRVSRAKRRALPAPSRWSTNETRGVK